MQASQRCTHVAQLRTSQLGRSPHLGGPSCLVWIDRCSRCTCTWARRQIYVRDSHGSTAAHCSSTHCFRFILKLSRLRQALRLSPNGVLPLPFKSWSTYRAAFQITYPLRRLSEKTLSVTRGCPNNEMGGYEIFRWKRGLAFTLVLSKKPAWMVSPGCAFVPGCALPCVLYAAHSKRLLRRSAEHSATHTFVCRRDNAGTEFTKHSAVQRCFPYSSGLC